MKTLLLVSLILILSCSRESINSKMGVLTLSLSSKENNFIYFDFVIENIYLVDKDNRHININGGIEKNINFSSLTNKSEIILNVNVPENTYYDVAIDINLNKSTIKDAGEGKAETPNLYDIYGLKVDENKSIYRIESNIDAGFPLIVKKDTPSHLSFELDIDATTRWLSTDDNGVSNILISPVFSVSSLIIHPDNIHLTGVFNAFNDKNVIITPIKFNAINQIPIEIHFSENTLHSFNHETQNIKQWKSNVANHKNGILIFSGKEKDNKLEATSLSYFTDSILYKNEGVITQEITLVGSREMLSKQQSSVEYLEQKLVNVASGTVIQSSYLTNKGSIDRDNKSRLTGTVKKSLNTGIELKPNSVNGHPSSLFFEEDKTINVYHNDDYLNDEDLVNLIGTFNEGGDFISNNFEFIDTEKQRLHLASSLSSMDDIITSATNEGFIINKDKTDDTLSYIKFSGLPIREDTEYNINKISFDYVPEKLIILTNRIQPSHDIYQLLNVKNFVKELEERRSQGYIINSIVADGNLNDDNFIARSLVVGLLPSNKLDTTATVLKGKTPYPLLKGSYIRPKVKFSNLSEYIKNNIKTFKNPFSREDAYKAPTRKKISVESIQIVGGNKIGDLSADEQKDIAALSANKHRKSADIQRNFTIYNSDLGGYFSSRINKLNATPDEIIKLFDQVEKIKPLKPLFNKSDKVEELKQIYILNQYLSDIQNNEVSRANKSIYHEYFDNGKNPVLLNSLLSETPKDFRRKSHEIDLNDVILRNDKTRTLEKLLINDTAAYKKIFDTYEKYLVKRFGDESLTNKYLWGTESGDKGQFLSKIEKLFKDGGSLKLDEEFTKINKIITDHIEAETLTNQTSQKTTLKLEDAFKTVASNTSEKKFASLISVESDTSNDIARLRFALTGIKPETATKPKILVDIPKLQDINLDINNLPKNPINNTPTKRRR